MVDWKLELFTFVLPGVISTRHNKNKSFNTYIPEILFLQQYGGFHSGLVISAYASVCVFTFVVWRLISGAILMVHNCRAIKQPAYCFFCAAGAFFFKRA